MSSRRHTAKHGWPRPDALDPYRHNAIAARRKKYRRLARELRTAGRSASKAAASFRMLGEAAQRAADSLRRYRDDTVRAFTEQP